MRKQNCWEFKKCGREPHGEKSHELGVCPAATFMASDGFCDGQNGGRACMYVTGTFCGGYIQGTYKDKEKKCGDCDFYKTLKKDHGVDMTVLAFGKYVGK